jgi:Transglycosylase SLT domain
VGTSMIPEGFVPLDDFFGGIEGQYGLPSGMLHAVMQVESGGNPRAVGPKRKGAQAQGAFQFMPATARRFGIDPRNTAQAAQAAAKYLALNYQQFGSWDKALAAYNAGEGAVAKYGGIPPYKETQGYVQKIMNLLVPAASASEEAIPELPAGFTPNGVPELPPGFIPMEDPPEQTSRAKTPYDPTEGMSGLETYLAGLGKTGYDLVLGIGQHLGLVSQEEIDEAKRLNAPLMNTGAGFAGNFTGNALIAAPALAIPGANTIAGSTLIGGSLGAIQPVASDESQLEHMGYGAAGGTLGNLVGRVLRAIAKGGKALVEPFYESGQKQVVGRTLQRFASDADAAARNAGRARVYISGSNPTLGEASGDAGLAQLQRGAQSVDPQIGGALAEREMANNAARISAIRGIAQNEPAREAAVSAREAATKPLYDAAKALTVEADDTLRELLKRPSMQKAWARAETLAKEAGETIRLGQDTPAQQVATGLLDASGNPIQTLVPAQSARYTGQGLHYLKMALDDLLDNPAQSGIGRNELRALAATRAELGRWLETNLVPYGQARATYAALSKPINQMDVGHYLYNKMQPALADFGTVPRTRAEMYANALRNAEQTVKNATGFEQPLEAVMTRGQMKTLTGVGKDLARRATAQDLGRSVGSNTAQNLASQNILRQTIGPLGLPESWAEATLLREFMRPVQFAYKGAAEPKIQEALARALLDPKYAATLMKSVAPEEQQLLAQILERALPLGGAALGASAGAQ